jgi:hypothetical protein
MIRRDKEGHMTMTAVRDDQLLTLDEAAKFLAIEGDEALAWLDNELPVPDQTSEDQVERWSVSFLRTFAQENDLPGDDDVLDLAGIAAFLGVAATTPQQWRQRGALPAADPKLSFPDKPVWRRGEIRMWAMFPPAEQPVRWPPGAAARTRGE